MSVETGPQSVGKAALSRVPARFDAEKFRAGVQACRRQGISVECDLIVGLPGDTAQDVLEGIDFAIGLDPARCSSRRCTCCPARTCGPAPTSWGCVRPEPPHEIIATAQVPFRELRRLEVLGNAATATTGTLPRKDLP